MMASPARHERLPSIDDSVQHERLAAAGTVQQALEGMDRRDFEQYKRELRRRDVSRLEKVTHRDFEQDHGGHPLGKGMPLGQPMRGVDGTTHRHGWMGVVRLDPCVFCGRPPVSTVDHIVPKSGTVHGLGGAHSWLNFAAACAGCNGSKGTRSLLGHLYARRWHRDLLA